MKIALVSFVALLLVAGAVTLASLPETDNPSVPQTP